MKTLVAYYQERKKELQSQLRATKTTEQVVKRVQDEINRLADISSEYIGGLNPSQARIALEMLRVLNLSFSTLTVVRPQDSTAPDLAQSKAKSSSEVTLLGSEIISGSLGGFSTGILTGGPIGAVIGTVVGGAGGVIVSQLMPKDTDTPVHPIRPDRTDLEIDIDALLSNLHQAFEAIDRAVAAYGGKSKETTPKQNLEDHSDLLEFLQNLMEDALDEQTQLPAFTRKRIEELPMILRHHGIVAKVYQPNEEKTSEIDAWSMFDFEPSLDPEIKEYVTLKPAFVKGNQVLLRGRVVKPASSTQH